MVTDDPDFIAELKYHRPENGGRSTPAFSSYMPQIKFPFSEMQTGGQQTFIGKDQVFPGETVEAEIRILSPNFFANQLLEGMDFEFREGSKIIGTGIIKVIVNQTLKKV